MKLYNMTRKEFEGNKKWWKFYCSLENDPVERVKAFKKWSGFDGCGFEEISKEELDEETMYFLEEQGKVIAANKVDVAYEQNENELIVKTFIGICNIFKPSHLDADEEFVVESIRVDYNEKEGKDYIVDWNKYKIFNSMQADETIDDLKAKLLENGCIKFDFVGTLEGRADEFRMIY